MRGEPRLPKRVTTRPRLGNSIRDRLKNNEVDILDVWNEQQELVKKRRNTSKSRKNKKILHHIKLAKESVHSSTLIVRKKLNSSTVVKRIPKSALVARFKVHRFVNKRNFVIFAISLVLFGGLVLRSSRPRSNNITSTLGAASTNQSETAIKIVQEQETEFPLAFPGDKNGRQLNIAKINPPSSATVYTFTDILGGVDIKVSEQKLPESFKEERDTKLRELAEGFQATNIIQIDEDKVYHGYSEKTKVQSLIFIKNNLLIFISAADKISDDNWAAYIISMK